MKMRAPTRIFLVVAAMLWAAIAPMASPIGAGHGHAHADTGAWQGNEVFRARLVSASKAIGNTGILDGGLEFRLEKGWKVYWRSPGDAGLPPQLDFGASAAGHRLDFPAPERFSILGLESYGYAESVVLPLRVTLNNNAPVTLRAALTGLVCKDVCIPVNETLTLAVAAAAGDGAPPAPSSHARAIAEAKARVPRNGTAAGVRLTGIAVQADDDSLVLGFTRGDSDLRYFPGDIFIEVPGATSGYGFAAPRWQNGRAHIKVTGKSAASLIGNAVIVTAVGPDFLLEARSTLAPSIAALARDGGGGQGGFINRAFIFMLAIAFLGGVILNAMPCVLPVLSLKLSSVLGQTGRAAAHIRRSFIATACGIVFSFLVLAGGLLAARAAGATIGWGVQFQQPVFLAAAAIAIGFFGVVLLDVVRLPVPAIAARLAPPVGKTQKSGGSLGGDFASGALATLLATPCSAPFVGTAVAFALTAHPATMLAVFFAMGLGLALPWLAVAVYPRMLAALPKPGGWLLWLKRILAVGLFATALWLASVLAGNYGISIGGAERDGGYAWQRWQPGLAEQITREQSRIVFVDVTAEWCITCKTNKALVLNTDSMRAMLAAENTAMLKADWTRPDENIAAYLAGFGRYGIPFNIVYGPGAPQGIILPEILTPRVVADALARAK